MVTALVGLLLACESGSLVPMPKELIGFWRTSAVEYQDRYLMLTANEVKFGIGEEESTIHDVSAVYDVGDALQRIYRISYLSDEGKEYWLSLEYEPGKKTLRLVNQPEMTWERTLSFD